MKPTPIIILGVNGNCLDIADMIALLQQRGEPVQALGFLDDADAVQGTTVAGLPVLGKLPDACRFAHAKFVCGIGSPQSYRQKPAIIAKTGVPRERWATLIHPQAVVSPQARLGVGCVLLSGVAVGARVQLGDHVVVLQNSVISHDSVIGNYAVIATSVSVSGLVQVGASCYLGANCTIRERRQIGAGALVGMGAVVTRDVAADSVVVGNPARPKV